MILSKNPIKSIDLDFETDIRIKSNRLDEILFIVPTNRKMRYLKKELISLSTNEAVSSINIETIGTFSAKIFFGEQKSKQKVLSESAAAVLLRQSFQEANTKYFSAYHDDIPYGTLERVRNVISEYKRHGITPELLKQESKKLKSSDKLKAEDIAAIYSIYQKKIKELDVNETGDIYEGVLKNSFIEFSDVFRKLYPSVNLIIINGFDEFTTPEIEIIDLISQISDSNLYLTFDYYRYNSLIFSHLEKCYDKLIQKGFKEIEEKTPDAGNSFQSIIKEKLFNKKYRSGEVNGIYNDKITIIKARKREEEIELVAKEIINLITEKKVEPHRICVAFNLIQKYSPLIRDIFTLYGLPYNLTDRFSLGNSAPVTALINFLEISENDYFYKNIFRALSSGYINIKGVDLSSLLRASRELKVLSGYERWTTAINEALSKKDDDDFFERASLKKEIYKKALESLNQIHNYLKFFKGKFTIKEFRIRFIDLMFSLELPVNLINEKGSETSAKSGLIEKNIKAVNTFIEITNEVLSLLEKEYGNDEKFNLKFFLNHLRTAAASARYNIKEKPGYGVQVTTLNEIRGLNFDYLFICSMCDGDLPTRYMPEIFLSGSFFKQEKIHQTEERYHFYQSLCSWKKGLYLTYPLSEERKELVQSNFLTEFKSIFNVKEKTAEDYKDTIYSKEELLKLAGRTDLKILKEKYKEKFILNTEEIEQAKLIDKTRRDDMYGDSPFTGVLFNSLNENEKDWLNDLKFRQYSISQLETYAKCPYKYFAERILRLEEIDEPKEEIEALEMGGLLHNIFYEFLKELKERKIVLFNCTNEEFNSAKKLLFEIAEKKIEEANFKSPLSFYEREKILGLNNNPEKSILYEFLKQEREKSEGYFPEFLEVTFGKLDKEDLPESVKNLKAGSVLVRGKIDRVDINYDTEEFRVVDYKLSGSRPTANDLYDAVSLQLPLYLFAAKELIKAQLNKDYKSSGADIYSLKYRTGEFGKKVITALSGSSAEDIIEKCISEIEKYVTSISEGRFHLTQLKDREKVCRYCSFRSVCRIEENN